MCITKIFHITYHDMYIYHNIAATIQVTHYIFVDYSEAIKLKTIHMHMHSICIYLLI